jgi:hypothetical protein
VAHQVDFESKYRFVALRAKLVALDNEQEIGLRLPMTLKAPIPRMPPAKIV